MQLSVRPYVTTGVAIVGASVIAAAPLQPVLPADVQIPNPVVQVDQAIQLTAQSQRFIEDSVNALIFNFVARPTVAGAEVLGRLLTPLIGEEQAFVLPLAALGLAAPLISGPGAAGNALQNLVDSGNLEQFLINLIDVPGTLADGLVNGGYGPDLAPLVKNILIALEPGLGMLPEFPTVLAGGLINDQEVDGFFAGTCPACVFIPTEITLPGTIPVLQGLVAQLFGLLSPEEMSNVNLMLAPPEPRPIEDGVNALTFAATKAAVSLAQLAAPLVARILDLPDEDAANLVLALGTIGFLGPLIGGAGGTGHALQDLVDSEGLEDFVINVLDVPKLVLGGAVNGVGGSRPAGPDLGPIIFPDVPEPYRPEFYGGGFINPGKLPPPLGPPALPPYTVPGTIPTVQGLVSQLWPSNQTVSEFQAPAGDNLKIGDDEKDVTPKRSRPLLNVLKLNPLDLGTKKETKNADSTSGKHRFGTPVRDVINKVLGHDDDNGSGGENDEKDQNQDEAE